MSERNDSATTNLWECWRRIGLRLHGLPRNPTVEIPLLPIPPIDPDATLSTNSSQQLDNPRELNEQNPTTLNGQDPNLNSFDNHPIFLLTKSDKVKKRDQEKLVDHPLVRTFVLSQWCIYGRWLNLRLFFCFYLTFLIPLVTLFWLQQFPCLDDLNFTVPAASSTIKAWIAFISAFLLAILSFVNFFKELFELYQKGIRYRSLENLVEMLLYMSALLFAILFLTTSYHLTTRPCTLDWWRWRISGFSVFVGWINLTLFLRKTPIGITVIAFQNVLLTFITNLPLIVVFLLAFSAGFYGFLHSSYLFRSFPTLLKVAVLIFGDYPTLDHILGINATDTTEESLTFVDSFFGAGVFILFLCVMAVVMMNMLVGIAVDEIAKVLKDSEINSMTMKAEWITEVRKFEQSGPKVLRSYLTGYIEKCYGMTNRKSKVYRIVDRKNENCFKAWLNGDLAKAEKRAKSICENSCATAAQAKLMFSLKCELSATKQLVLSLPREMVNIKETVDNVEKMLQLQLREVQKQQSILLQILERLPK